MMAYQTESVERKKKEEIGILPILAREIYGLESRNPILLLIIQKARRLNL